MKAVLLLLFVSLLPMASEAAVNTGRPTKRTPYDPYMRPVHGVLRQNSGKASPEETRELLKTAYGFRYEHKTPYVAQAPAVTEQRQTGDCKDKALWLCDEMNDSSVRFVVGKTHAGAKQNHAWLSWQSEGKTWILDPTNSARPIAAESVAAQEYVPIYSYSRGGKYAHGAKSTAEVAGAEKARK